MSYLQKINRCNNASLDTYVPLSVDTVHVGWVKKKNVVVLEPWLCDGSGQSEQLELHSQHQSLESRNQIFSDIVSTLTDIGIIRIPMGEMYPVTIENREDVIALVDRVAASFFGIRCYGQHLNGYVKEGEQIKMWIGRRARDRQVEPGKLDQLVAGGLPNGISPHENLLKECYEEAGIRRELAQQARAVGTISYFAESAIGLKPDTLYVYDLELPGDFEPVCTDGEVEAFYLMPIEEVAERIQDSDEFKHNCNIVIIDFLVRHGFISDDHPAYTNIVAGMHPTLPALG